MKVLIQFEIVKYLNDNDNFRYLLYMKESHADKTLIGNFNYRKLIMTLSNYLD